MIDVHDITADRFNEWNNFVDDSPQGDVFCYSWWLDSVTGSNFRIVAVIDNGNIVAGMPLAFDKHNKINEPFFTRTTGVLYKPLPSLTEHDRISVQRKWLGLLLNEINTDDFIQVSTHHNFTDWLPYRWKGLKQTSRYTYILDYRDKSPEDLWKGLNRGRKNIINRAGKNNIRVEETDDFDVLYEYTGLSYERQGLRMRTSFDDMKALDNSIIKNGNRLILKACDPENRIHAVIYLVYTKRSAYYLLSGSDPGLRRMGGHSLVLWEAVRYFRDKVGYFNFGGSDIQSIENHISGFGGTLTPYFHIYNEKLLHYYEIRFHLKKVKFHLCGLLNAVKSRFFLN